MILEKVFLNQFIFLSYGGCQRRDRYFIAYEKNSVTNRMGTPYPTYFYLKIIKGQTHRSAPTGCSITLHYVLKSADFNDFAVKLTACTDCV